MWYTGIDQHKQFCVLTTYGTEGARVKQARVPSAALALQAYCAQFSGPHRAVVESTGAWYWLADLLATLGVELVLAHATRLKAIAAAKVKTDQVDSDTLALLLRADLIPRAHMIAPAQRGPRDLMRTRLRLVEKCVSAQNSIDRLLEKFNATDVRQLDELYQLQASCHAGQIALLTRQITTLERALYPYLIPDAEVQRLLWIPGLGKVNAFTIYTEINGISRFPSPRQFFSYCRLVPGADNSGGRTRHRSGSKAGSRYLKARLQPRRHPGRPVPSRDPVLLQNQSPQEAAPDRAHAGRARAGADRLSRPRYPGGIQRPVQGSSPESSEAREVATPGKPVRLTASAQAGARP
jgi:transposase